MITEYDDNYIAREVAVAALAVAPNLTNDAEVYLSTLMVDLMTNWVPEDFDKPLALWLAELQSAPMYERATGLRKLGNTALLKIGLFRSAFAATGLSPAYYVSIGSNAYRSSANIYKTLQVYTGLSVYLNAMAAQVVEASDVLVVLQVMCLNWRLRGWFRQRTCSLGS